MIDIHFVEFYVKVFHKQTLENYFNVTPAVTSSWRKKSFPEKRLNEFIVKEQSFSIYELFERIYPKK